MSEENRETIYDEQVAPLLMKAAKICESNGLPMLAVVWYSDTGHGRTAVNPDDSPPGAGPSFRLTHAAAQCEGNLDRLIIAISREVGDNHTSAILTMLEGATR